MNGNTTETSPYTTPDSDLYAVEGSHKITNFKRFSAWGVFGLGIITFGMYPIYWLYTRSKTLNSFSENGISAVLLNILILFVVVSFSSGVLSGFMPENSIIAAANGILTLPYMILYLVVLYKLRNRLNDITESKIGPIITFFGSSIYLQYKINEEIDNQ